MCWNHYSQWRTKDGLASVIKTKCSACNHTIVLETSEKVKGPRGHKRWECEPCCCMGPRMVTGGGHSNLEETMSVLGVPVLAKNTLSRQSVVLGSGGDENLRESILEAGREKRLAEERGDFHHGVPGNNSSCRRGME